MLLGGGGVLIENHSQGGGFEALLTLTESQTGQLCGRGCFKEWLGDSSLVL